MAKARSNNEDLNWREFAALDPAEREEITRRVLELKLTKLDPDVCRESGILITLLGRILHANRCEQRGRRIHAELFGMSQHQRLTVAMREPVDATTLETFSGRPLPDLANYSPRRREMNKGLPEVEVGQIPPEVVANAAEPAPEPRRHRPDFAVPPRSEPQDAEAPRNNREKLAPPPPQSFVSFQHQEFGLGMSGMVDSLNRKGSGSMVVEWVDGRIVMVNTQLEPPTA